MKNLHEYIYLMKGVLPEKFCDDLVSHYSNSNEWFEHTWSNYDGVEGINTSRKREKELLNVYLNGIHEEYLNHNCRGWISSYQRRHRDDFLVMRGHSKIRINRYVTGTSMDAHNDNIVSLFEAGAGSPILSLVGCLNDDYEGGDFIMFDNLKIQMKKGDVLIFPSAFMYTHRVENVTKGERWSFVTWMF